MPSLVRQNWIVFFLAACLPAARGSHTDPEGDTRGRNIAFNSEVKILLHRPSTIRHDPSPGIRHRISLTGDPPHPQSPTHASILTNAHHEHIMNQCRWPRKLLIFLHFLLLSSSFLPLSLSLLLSLSLSLFLSLSLPLSPSPSHFISPHSSPGSARIGRCVRQFEVRPERIADLRRASLF